MITIVRQWNIDTSHERDAILVKAASSGCRLIDRKKSVKFTAFIFYHFMIMTDPLRNIVNEFDGHVGHHLFSGVCAFICALTIMALSLRKLVCSYIVRYVCRICYCICSTCTWFPLTWSIDRLRLHCQWLHCLWLHPTLLHQLWLNWLRLFSQQWRQTCQQKTTSQQL